MRLLNEADRSIGDVGAANYCTIDVDTDGAMFIFVLIPDQPLALSQSLNIVSTSILVSAIILFNCRTVNQCNIQLGSSYKAKSMDHIKDVIRYGKLQYNRQYASMGEIF